MPLARRFTVHRHQGGPGITYEKSIGKHQAIYTELSVLIGAAWSYSDNFGSQFDFSADPAFNLQCRYYYNGTRRSERGKRIAMNSMNSWPRHTHLVFKKSIFLIPARKNGMQYRWLVYYGVCSVIIKIDSASIFLLEAGIESAKFLPPMRTDNIIVKTEANPTVITNIKQGFWLNRRSE
ncbi:hypothetical protein BH10BAC3_BH10BAC3_35920 [soil metagenome]